MRQRRFLLKPVYVGVIPVIKAYRLYLVTSAAPGLEEHC